MNVTVDKDGRFVRCNDYRVFKESSERKLSGQEAILNAMTVSLKHLEKMSWLENEKRLPETTNKELMRRYVEQRWCREGVCGADTRR